MGQNPYQIAQKICLSTPQSKEFIAHGAPNFRVKKGKIFAVYAQNHQGDKRVALWLNSPPGAQGAWVEPKTFAKSAANGGDSSGRKKNMTLHFAIP